MISTLLGAPAMFFWGVGTSNIGATFGWSESLSATALAVATICIPALDAFFNSKVVEQWYEQVCRAGQQTAFCVVKATSGEDDV